MLHQGVEKTWRRRAKGHDFRIAILHGPVFHGKIYPKQLTLGIIPMAIHGLDPLNAPGGASKPSTVTAGGPQLRSVGFPSFSSRKSNVS